MQLRDAAERDLRGGGLLRAREAETGREFVTRGGHTLRVPPGVDRQTLAEVVRDINKFSNNVMAQQLLLTLALQRPGATRATPEAGREALRGWLGERLGESLDGVVIDNGSGLSRSTRISAQRLESPIASARSLPAVTSGSVVIEAPNATCIFPPSMSFSAWGPPL